MVDCDQPVPLYRALSALEETFFLVFRVINMDVYCCVLYVETLFRNRECAVYSYELWSQCSHVLSSNIISFNVEIKYIWWYYLPLKRTCSVDIFNLLQSSPYLIMLILLQLNFFSPCYLNAYVKFLRWYCKKQVW